MIEYSEAKKIALTRRSDLNGCFEYQNAYVFSSSADAGYIGGMHSPIVVMKKDGAVVDMIRLVNSGTGKEIGWREF